jgi:putative ABC transport system permease protein
MRHDKLLIALTVFGVALGVAAVWGIQLINHNAVAAFRASLQSVTGEADLSVSGLAASFDETLFPKVLGTQGIQNAWPLIHTEAGLSGHDKYFLEILGADFLADHAIPWKDASLHTEGALSDPGWTAVSKRLAQEQAWHVGDVFSVSYGSRRITLKVGAIVDFSVLRPQSNYKLVLMDIAQAQRLFGLTGKLQQIDVQIAPGETSVTIAARLKERLGSRVQVLTPEEQEKRASGLLDAFRMNLTALSLISLLVGFFLVTMSIQASIVRRRAEFGLMRTLGATRGQILRAVLKESLFLGVLGTTIGMPLGYTIAAANLHSVSATVSNLYLLAEVQHLQISPLLFILGIAIGLGGALTGALWPAIDLSRTDTLRLLGSLTLQEQLQSAARPMAKIAVAVLLFTAALYFFFSKRFPIVNFGLAAGLLISLLLMVPRTIQLLCARLPTTHFGFFYSARQLDRGLQTVSMAVGALAIAISMLVGVTQMIESFRETLHVWARHTLQADIYISPESWLRSRELSTLDAPYLSALEHWPGVLAVDTQRAIIARFHEHRVTISGIRTDLPIHPERFVLREGDTASIEARVKAGGILLGEPFSRRAQAHVGDTITIDGPQGPVTFSVAGIFSDFTVDYGTALLDRAVMTRAFGEGPINNAALYLAPGTDADQVVDALKNKFPDKPLLVRSNRTLLIEIFRLFDQTFAVTRILELLAVIIAACGIALTLLILARERAAELALYAALGATRRQRLFFFLGKGLGMGILGLALGLIGGLGLALILVYAVNRTYFGWTIPLAWPGWILAKQAALVLGVCVLASVWPGWKSSGIPATELTREEL